MVCFVGELFGGIGYYMIVFFIEDDEIIKVVKIFGYWIMFLVGCVVVIEVMDIVLKLWV